MGEFPTSSILSANLHLTCSLSDKETAMTKKIHLAWFGGSGVQRFRTADGWYEWSGGTGRKRLDASGAQDIARACERACFDMVLFPDISVIAESFAGGRAQALRSGHGAVAPEALPFIGFMAAVTQRVGLGVTVSATYWPPFILARTFGTYHHLTGGRFAWNVVTQTNEASAANYGWDLLNHDERYERAQEHIDLVKGLWTSWDDDAIVADSESGVFADPDKVHALGFEGQWYRSRGPLPLPQPPGGGPVIIQAGNSPRGIEFAVRNSELVITHKNSLADIKDYVNKVRTAASDQGLDPYSVKIFTSIKPNMGPTDAAAEEIWQQRMANASIEQGLNTLSYTLNLDLSQFPLDQPLPEDLKVTGIQSKLESLYPKGERRRTLEELARADAMHETLVMKGSYVSIADQIEDARDQTGVDGFHVRAIDGYGYCVEFVEHLVPVLQHRGLHRREYAGTTLRDHLNEF
jgi:FMN-dependent oxidoreductase (nitrilotriacetate monooxygenase family)